MSNLHKYILNIYKTNRFNLFVSGISQINTLVANIIYKIKSSADMFLLKCARSTIKIKSSMKQPKCYLGKGFSQNIILNFKIVSKIKNIKNITSSILTKNIISSDLICSKKMSQNITFYSFAQADISIGKYRKLSEFSNTPLSELSDVMLANMIYTQT